MEKVRKFLKSHYPNIDEMLYLEMHQTEIMLFEWDKAIQQQNTKLKEENKQLEERVKELEEKEKILQSFVRDYTDFINDNKLNKSISEWRLKQLK